MTRVAILISGGGSNMVALVESMVAGRYATPVLVLSNSGKAPGLDRAQALSVDTAVVDHRDYSRREDFDAALNARLEVVRPDVICLAGFMRVLTPVFTERWAGRVLNIHPSLLPKYPGLDTHRRALDAGDTEAGCTVHVVTSALDDGPLLGQARVPVKTSDTPETLASRVLLMEHRLYPAVLRRFVTGETAPLYLRHGAEEPMNAGLSDEDTSSK